MKKNQLELAQPSIESKFPLSHAIMGRKLNFSDFPRGKGSDANRIVGRLKNFIEIVAHVSSRSAWRYFHRYIFAENRSGWGYHCIRMGRKGIIGTLPVNRVRPVQSNTPQSEIKLQKYLAEVGLFRIPALEQGWLFE